LISLLSRINIEFRKYQTVVPESIVLNSSFLFLSRDLIPTPEGFQQVLISLI
jgi:hypothetical protein